MYSYFFNIETVFCKTDHLPYQKVRKSTIKSSTYDELLLNLDFSELSRQTNDFRLYRLSLLTYFTIPCTQTVKNIF